MLDFGKLVMDSKTTFYLCDFFKNKEYPIL